MRLQVWWKKEKSSLQEENVSDGDCEKLMSDTDKENSERKHFCQDLVVILFLCFSLCVSCLELKLIFSVLRKIQQLEPESNFSASCDGQLKFPSVDSNKILVSLMYNELFHQRHPTIKSPEAAIQRYLKAGTKTDNTYPSVFIANGNSNDASSGNFIVKQDSIEIPQKGMYEVTTIATVKITHNVTKTMHALYKHKGKALSPLMQRSYAARAEVMAFHQSVLRDTFLLDKGDNLSVFVSGISSVYEKTTPISIRYIGQKE
ncbi:uncharacterized protein LOC133187132 [Saccostrea echinata]|uniref:uncharacterized protein LOC133187132 n=1 Tax=Saccostrea echinata TaxID=191078 RepID=UPI002A8354E6|nr:uncharacterized protein LOC133187132 [Saccostrea echinata]